MPYLGELAGVATALSWAICGMGFALAGQRIGALAVNQIRILAAVLILSVAHALASGEVLPGSASPRQLAWLALSGLAGLALGDTFYFHAITVLGPRIGSVLMATAPLMCAVIAWSALGEALDARAVGGILAAATGVAMVLADGRDSGWQPARAAGGRRALAVIAGLLGALGQASGMVMAKLGMASGTAEVPVAPLSATLVRMLAGAAGVVVIATLGRHWAHVLRATRDQRAMAATALGVAFGPTLGVWLSLVSVSRTDTGVAASLAALPPVFMIPIARVVYGARPGRRAIAGTLLAVAGTALIFLRR
jgi:drug/metabolite transporter (DMT)-like permease